MSYEMNYIQILIDGLKKKYHVLMRISELNAEQAVLAADKELDFETFGITLEKKQECIDELNKLDEGFETVYKRVKDELNNRANLYEKEVILLKELVNQVTEKSIGVQAEEERNRQAIQGKFDVYKKEIRKFKVSSQVTNSYYKNMNGLEVNNPVFMDKKK